MFNKRHPNMSIKRTGKQGLKSINKGSAQTKLPLLAGDGAQWCPLEAVNVVPEG